MAIVFKAIGIDDIRKKIEPNPESTQQAYTSTYVIDYHCNSLDDLQRYFDKFAKDLQAEHAEKFKDQFKSSRNILEDQFTEWFELISLDKYAARNY